MEERYQLRQSPFSVPVRAPAAYAGPRTRPRNLSNPRARSRNRLSDGGRAGHVVLRNPVVVPAPMPLQDGPGAAVEAAEGPPVLGRQPDQTAGAGTGGQPVAGDHDGAAVVGRPGDLVERDADPLPHLGHALAGGRTADVLAPAQLGVRLGVGLLELVPAQPLPGADVDLSQPR